MQVAWPLISKFSCSSAVGCEKSGNMGWRYLLYVLGVFTFFLWGCRFFAFTLLESPRFLSGIGKDKEAVDVIYQLAKYNGKTTTLSVEELEVPGQIQDGSPSQPRRNALSEASKRHAGHIKALFATPKMALSTSLLISVWGMVTFSIRSEDIIITVLFSKHKRSLVFRRCSTITFCLTCELRCN